MVTGNIVPLKTVIVEIVQNGQTRFIIALSGLTVIGLCLIVSTSVAPVTGVALAGRTDLGTGSGPEPSVLIWWLQIGSVTSGKVAFASRCPDISNATARDSLFDEFVFL